MPKGTLQKPRVETKLTAVSMNCNGHKVNTFLMLPIISGKTVLPRETQIEIEKDLGAERGDTIGMG
jgi:hypothetical protein